MNSFINKIYLYRFLDAFILIGVIFALFFSKQGLAPFQISILIGIWSVTTLVTEVPMGTVADKYSRRNLLIIGVILKAVGFGFWLIGGFINYAIGFVLWGLKNTLTSGTLEAFVYDELVFYKHEKLYEKINGKMSAYFSAGLMLSAVVGGIIAEVSFSYVLIASMFSSLIVALVLLTIRDVKQTHSTGEEKYFQLIYKAVDHIKTNKSLLAIILFIVFVFSAYGAVDEYWTLIFEDLDISTGLIGILTAAIYGTSILAGYTVHLFKKHNQLIIVFGALLFLFLGITKSIVLIPLAFIAIYLFQIANIKLETQLQHNIKSSQRATISSLKSFMFEIVYLVFVLLFGFVGTKFNVLSILIFAGSIILITLTAFKIFAKTD